MVDVGRKGATVRSATAQAIVRMNAPAYRALAQGALKKGDALITAQIAGVLAAKRAAELIPLCHPLALTLYDMCKALDRGIEVTSVRLLEKSGGKSGRYRR